MPSNARLVVVMLLLAVVVQGCGGGFRSFVSQQPGRTSVTIASVAIGTVWRDDARIAVLPEAADSTLRLLESRLGREMQARGPSELASAPQLQGVSRFVSAGGMIYSGGTGQRAPALAESAGAQRGGELDAATVRALAAAAGTEYVATLVVGWEVLLRRRSGNTLPTASVAARLRIYDRNGVQVFHDRESAYSDRVITTDIAFGRALPEPDEVTVEHWIEATDEALAKLLGQPTDESGAGR